MIYLFSILFSLSALAGPLVDVVFDIDLTIVAHIPSPDKDLLADPSDPVRGTVNIEFHDEGKLHSERYRIYEGMTDLMERLKRDPRVRVSFFSGGTEARNEALLKKILLPDGSSLWDLAEGRVYGRSSMTPTGTGTRIREKFKKDLRTINADISDVIIIDDIKEFVPDHQAGHMLWIGEDFPYPERYDILNPVTPELLKREKTKYQWISLHLDRALAERFRTGRPLSVIIQEISQNRSFTPFSRGLGTLGCTPGEILQQLLRD